MTPHQQVLDHEAAIALAQQNSAMDAVATARARAAAEDIVAATRLARERKLHEDEARRTLEQRTAAETAASEALQELVRTERHAADAAAMRAEAEQRAMEAAKARLEAETELAKAKSDAREALRVEAEAKGRRIEADERAAILLYRYSSDAHFVAYAADIERRHTIALFHDASNADKGPARERADDARGVRRRRARARDDGRLDGGGVREALQIDHAAPLSAARRKTESP